MPLDDIQKNRLDKLDAIIKSGENPYPAKSWRTHTVAQALEHFADYAENRKYIVLVGRVMARREHGGSMFLNLEDGSGTIQIYLKKDKLGERDYTMFAETIDLGDIIEVYGVLFTTKKEERTLEVEKYRILSKSLLPLPEKWHGLQDVEERYRKRYLDLMFNHEVRAKFVIRSKIYKSIRNYLETNDFLEVTTPTLQPLYGGASARPFKTHLHALDMDLFLRIAPELYLKRLLVGGIERVYEFSTNFRNEGMDREHNPEFAALEFYIAYHEYEWGMKFIESMFDQLVQECFGTSKIAYQEQVIDFKAPYKRMTFNDLVKEAIGISYDDADEDDLRNKADALHIAVPENATKAALADELLKKIIRPKLIQPMFVTDYPVEMRPLAKLSKNPAYAESFQLYAGGFELINAFSELNDPIDQRKRFEEQEQSRAKGDEEAQRMDEDYVEALEYGLPPAFGCGIGIDRLVALLTDSHSVREVILFPLMRPKV